MGLCLTIYARTAVFAGGWGRSVAYLEFLPEDPRSIGPYRLLGRLDAGGMGQVYLAQSPTGKTAHSRSSPGSTRAIPGSGLGSPRG